MDVCILSGIDCSSYLMSSELKKHNVSIVLPSIDVEPLISESIQLKLEKMGFHVQLSSYSEEELIQSIKSTGAKLLLSIGWRRILKTKVISLLDMSVNIHPAILPYYKGYHTEPYVIMNGEKEHGITAHLLTEDLDNGDIILQYRFPISNFSTVKSLKSEVVARSSTFLAELLVILQSGSVTYKRQNDLETKVIAGKRTPMDSEINPDLPLSQLYNTIRSSDPDNYPAFFYKDGKRIGIKLFSLEEIKDNEFDI